MNIGKLNFDPPIFLAPMAGVTDRAYRVLIREMGCPLVFGEMVSVRGIHYRNERTLKMLESDENERPLAIQLFGNEPEVVSEGAKYLESLGSADIIDFNMGCPAPKIVNNGDGSALLKDPQKAYKILSALKKSVSLPVTVKMRIGWDGEHINATEMAKLAEDAGVDAIAVHGRTREEFYMGRANWEIIAKVKETMKIPVIANGDVRCEEDLDEIRKVTNCDGVMIGRAAEGNPWIFKRLIHYYRTGEKLSPPDKEEIAQTMLRHLRLLIKFKGDYIGVREMRKHAAWYTKGMAGGARLREMFNTAESEDDFLKIIYTLGGKNYV